MCNICRRLWNVFRDYLKGYPVEKSLYLSIKRHKILYKVLNKLEIILIRHGKPQSAHNDKVNAIDYLKWIRAYDLSKVADTSRPEEIQTELGSYYLISSDLARAIHSTELYTQRSPDLISSLFKEMDIPRYKLPFTLRPMTWVYLCRALWMLGIKGPFESYKAAKQRAQLATEQLIEIAGKEDKLVLFGHGFMNLHIRKQLLATGWEMKCKSNGYWGVSHMVSPKASN